ncbi:unnamed protein product [Tilletia caries]|nr:unnamed protein product [Tilletia caries]
MTYSPVLEAWASEVATAHSNHVAVSASGAPVWALVKVIASSIIEVFLLSSVGYILARRGVIDKKTQTKINKLNVSFFTPALLFSKVAFTLNPARLAELYIVPIGFVIITLVSSMSALLLSKIAGLSKAQRNFAIACAMSPNSNSLPVALMQSLVVTVPQLRWDEPGQPKDTKDGMLGRALTYLVLFSTLGLLVRWSIGAKLLSSVEEADFDNEAEEDSVFAAHSGHYRDEPEQERLIHFEEGDTDQQRAASSTTTTSASQSPDEPIPPPIVIRKPTGDDIGEGQLLLPSDAVGRDKHGRQDQRSAAWARSFPNTPDESSPSPPPELEDAPVPRQKKSFFRRYIVRPLAAANNFMTMPLWAAILSLVVALITPLQKFIDSLEPVVGALKTAGACSIPLTMVVLGSYFYEDKTALQSLGARSTPQSAALQGATRDSDELAGIQTGQSTLVEPSSGAHKRRSIPWIKNPWNSAPTSEAGSRGDSLSGSGSLSASGALSENQSEAGGDSSTSVGSAAASEGGPEGARAQGAWAKLAERNAARNSRNGTNASAGSNGHNSGQQTWSRQAWKEEVKQKRVKTMERRTIAVAVASRMVMTPLILLPTAAWYAVATRCDMDDPVFITSACLLIGSPPALTLAQITSQSASGNNGFERLISKTIFVSYAIMAAPTTIGLVLAALLISQHD